MSWTYSVCMAIGTISIWPLSISTNVTRYSKVVRYHIMTRICSEKCAVRLFCAYTNLYNIGQSLHIAINKWGTGMGMMDHAYNPSQSGGRDWENCNSKSAGAKVSETPISTNKPCVVVWFYNPRYMTGIVRRPALRKNAILNPKKN
jgi:hypothetical protein